MIWGTRAVTDLQPAPTLGKQPVELKVSVELVEEDVSARLAKGVQLLYQSGEFCDVIIVAAGERFPAHRSVLAAASEGVRDFLREQATTAISESSLEGAAGTSGTAVEARDAGPASLGAAELHLSGISHGAAVRLLLEHIYGLAARGADDFEPGSEDVNKDVLRLAQRLRLPRLEEQASRWLARDGLTSANVVQRLVTCQGFELTDLFSAIEGQLAASAPALSAVTEGTEILDHPRILQSVLVKTVSTWSSYLGQSEGKIAAEPPSKRTRQGANSGA